MKESEYNIEVMSNQNYRIIYNSLSKSIVKLSQDININSLKNDDDYTYKTLLDNGIILENNSIREIDKIEFLYRKSFFDSDQLNIILYLELL